MSSKSFSIYLNYGHMIDPTVLRWIKLLFRLNILSLFYALVNRFKKKQKKAFRYYNCGVNVTI